MKMLWVRINGEDIAKLYPEIKDLKVEEFWPPDAENPFTWEIQFEGNINIYAAGTVVACFDETDDKLSEPSDDQERKRRVRVLPIRNGDDKG